MARNSQIPQTHSASDEKGELMEKLEAAHVSSWHNSHGVHFLYRQGTLRSLAPLAAGHGCKGPGVATTGDAACASAAFNFCEALFLAFLRAFSSAAEQR